ncbi:MAG TPA: GNAT family N-acetyltransferase [Myxococcota bacterium]|nr:GNAT family N-acetyltransferase [Myxococcota bacterium]
MSLSVRSATLADRDAILAINRAGMPGVSAFEPAELERCISAATLFWVAERGGEPCGYLLAFAHGFAGIGDEYAWFSARHAAFLYVDSIAIAERARRSGVGAALYARLEDEARRRGIARLSCEVNLEPPNPQSLAFHGARGFREVGRLRVRDGRFVALLEREIGAGALQK